jgi:excinuclease ABC subunit C
LIGMRRPLPPTPPEGGFQPDREFFRKLPTSPGVYLMKDRSGQIIYVGKAKNLRARVRQYFRPGDDVRFFVASGLLGRALAGVDTVVVENEKEALLLENHLIKKHQPRFNVKLRDDKQYLVLRIDPAKSYPRVEVVRHIKNDGARYFGPYHSASSCRETLRTVNRYFQLRTCTDHVLATRKRPCLQYQIKRCPGPCAFPVPEAEYGEQVEDVMMFLAGKNQELVARLTRRMESKAEGEQFEAAGQLRDSIYAVDKTLARQDVVQDSFVDQDVFGFFREADAVEVVVLFVRAGKLVGRRSFRQRDQEFPDEEVLASFVQQYYATGTLIPDEVVVPIPLEDAAVIADWLGEQRGRKVKILTPQRGLRTRLVSLAMKNAAAAAVSRSSRDDDARAALAKLQQRLGLRRLPQVIECFDIAHIQGDETVASRVVFRDGVPDNSSYRHFKVRSVTNDDFAAMYEVIKRRFARARGAPDEGEPGDAWAMPDLLVIDGGRGQLGSAIAAITDLGIPVAGERGLDVIGLAKEKRGGDEPVKPDRVFLRHLKDPLELRSNTTELFLLARIRDEAHRFANTFHRKQRKKSRLRSALDDVPGIGPKRRRELLRHFGSLRGIKEASIEELAAVKGMSRAAAEAIAAHLHSADDQASSG